MAKLLLFLPVISLVTAQNTVYYPPQSDSSSQSSLTVHAGDTINVTWSVTYSSVDLAIRASAQDSNFTQSPYYVPGLPPISYFMYVFQPRDYLIDDSFPIAAYFLLSDHLDSTQFIETENFTILQPAIPSYINGQVTIPANALTWTGSETLYSGIGIGVAPTATPTSTATALVAPSVATTTTENGSASISTVIASATPTPLVSNSASSGLSSGPKPTALTGSSTATTTKASGAALSGIVSFITVSATAGPSISNSTSSGLSSGAKIGIGVGAAAGLLLLAGIALAACLIARRRRESGTDTLPMMFEADSKAQGQRLREMEGTPAHSELDCNRPRFELGADK